MKLKKTSKKIRYAVIGLGHIAQVAVLPAFKNAKNSELVALISSTPDKLKKVGAKYKIPKTFQFSYDEFPACLEKAEIDVLYIALPNHMHCEYAIKAMDAGVHVLCEKPLAITQDECIKMISRSKVTQTKLMIAYRLHFEASNLEASRIANNKTQMGDLRLFNSTFTMQVKDKNNIRLNPLGKGGGPIWDIGIYCLNAVRSLFRAEPTEVFAFAETGNDPRFSKSPEMMSVMMRFPENRLATFVCSFGASGCASYEIVGTKGRVHLEKAFEYATKRELTYLKDDEAPKIKNYKKADQFGPELAYFSNCILTGKHPETSGEEGLADVRAIEAVIESLRTGKAVKIRKAAKAVMHPRPRQIIQRKGISPEPKVIRATAPHS